MVLGGRWILAGGMAFLVGASAARCAAPASYRIKVWGEGSQRQAAVRARLSVVDDRLEMAQGGGIDQLPAQWTTFVTDLEARTPDGRPVRLRHLGKEGWRIEGSVPGEIDLEYRIDLSFTRAPWPPGNEQAGWEAGSALYLVTKPLFVYARGQAASEVEFDLPSGWTVSTPWKPGAGAHRFEVATVAELVENSLVVGRQNESRFVAGPFRFSLVSLDLPQSASALLARTLERITDHTVEVFPATPSRRFLLTVFRAPQDDGESFEDSAAITVHDPPRPEGLPLWGNDLAHELYHYWIGDRIHLADRDTGEWFDEGFTDYYADMALVQEGLVSPDAFLRKLEKVLARYRYFQVAPVFPRLSLAEASRHKGRYRFGVYDGGWSLAFCLDTAILESTGGEKSLDDLMRELYRRFALVDRAFTLDDLVALARDLGGDEATRLIIGSVEGAEGLPLPACLERVGLTGEFQPYADELWIYHDPDAGPDANRNFGRLVALRATAQGIAR
jgi:predicted metalloprotease with PDZ domain